MTSAKPKPQQDNRLHSANEAEGPIFQQSGFLFFFLLQRRGIQLNDAIACKLLSGRDVKRRLQRGMPPILFRAMFGLYFRNASQPGMD
jgi:hypothetical protein